MITITLQEYEVNDPDKGNCYYLRGEVADEGYTGWSNFVVMERDLRAFSRELKAFAKDFRATPELKTGWGNEVYFRVRFEKGKSTGALWVNGEIATPAHHKINLNAPCSHRFVFGFPMDPVQLDSFMADLVALMDGARKEIVLGSRKE